MYLCKTLGLTDTDIVLEVARMVDRFSKLSGQAKEDHGYFSLRDDASGGIILIRQIGPCIIDEKADKYFHYSLEKGERLFQNPSHKSSWQSRDPEKHQYGGAIRVVCGALVLSFSGLPELGDEAVLLATAVNLKWMDRKQAEAIASISKNPFLEQLLEKHEF